MVCKKCKIEIEKDSKFCRICGSEVNNVMLIKEFILKHSSLFLSLLPLFYKFNYRELGELYMKIEWGKKRDFQYGFGLSSNEKLKWDMDLIDSYKEYIDFSSLIGNSSFRWNLETMNYFDNEIDWDLGLVFWNKGMNWSTDELDFIKKRVGSHHLSSAKYIPWTKEMIRNNIEFLDWRLFSQNDTVHWSLEMLIEFEELIDWNALLLNEKFVINREVYERFSTKFLFYSKIDYDNLGNLTYEFGADTKLTMELFKELKPLFIKEKKWLGLSANQILDWNFDFIEEYEAYWDWTLLSYNSSVPWSDELLLRYKGKVDFRELSGNKNLDLSPNGIKSFYNQIQFGTKEEEGFSHNTTIKGLDCNLNIFKHASLIEEYEDEWNWDYLIRNPSCVWTREFYDRFHERIHSFSFHGLVPFKKKIWDGLFEGSIDEIDIPSLVDEILENNEKSRVEYEKRMLDELEEHENQFRLKNEE